jgi:hypothetical protein
MYICMSLCECVRVFICVCVFGQFAMCRLFVVRVSVYLHW